MEEEYSARPMVDVLKEITKKDVVGKNGVYVYLDDKSSVSSDDIDMANQMLEDEKSEFLAEQEIETRKTVGEDYTLDDVVYKVPFTNADAIGMLQVKSAFELGLEETNIYFSNKTVVPMKTESFEDFAKWFVEKRNSFFI